MVAARLEIRADDPPVYLEVSPPFSPRWVRRLESVGAVPISDGLRERIATADPEIARADGWRLAREAAERAREAGFAGVVLMGLRFETVVGEAHEAWHTTAASGDG